MSTETSPSPTRRDAGWVRPVILAVSCLVIGFVGGWALRGGESDPIVLPPAPTAGTTTTPTRTAPQTVTRPPAAPPPAPVIPPAADVRLAVLNGSSVTGLAGRTADRAKAVGFTGVTAGNAPTQTGPTIVYFRAGQRPAALRVAQDLGYSVAQVKPVPADPAIISAAPADAQVILVVTAG